MTTNSNQNSPKKNGGVKTANGKTANGKAGKKKMNLALKFALIVFGMVFVFIIVAGVGVMAYISNRTYQEARTPNIYEDNTQSASGGVAGTVKRIFERVPERTNFLILGVDDEGGGIRSDTMMIGSFDSKSKKIFLVSVPRDIMVSIPKEDIKEYNELGIYPPEYMKMNEVLAWVGPEYGIAALMRQMEHEFGINLDYYVKVDTDGFVEIVDALGGVEMTLTRNYNYYDPDQDLRINLKAGPQVLMGKDAEGFVRYRADYAGGDLQRIGVQQEFLQELFKQTLQKDNLIQNAPELLRTFLDNVTTDMTITQASKYLQFLPALTVNNLETFTLGNDDAVSYRGNDGLSYIRLDDAHVENVIEQAFFGLEEAPPNDSKGLKISVLNGSGVSGHAKRTSEMLEDEGYTVSEIGDYQGEKADEDRIFVKKDGYGADLTELFENSEIIVDKSNVSKGADITVVLGRANAAEDDEE